MVEIWLLACYLSTHKTMYTLCNCHTFEGIKKLAAMHISYWFVPCDKTETQREIPLNTLRNTPNHMCALCKIGLQFNLIELLFTMFAAMVIGYNHCNMMTHASKHSLLV